MMFSIGYISGIATVLGIQYINRRRNTIDLSTHTFFGEPRFHTHQGDHCQHCMNKLRQEQNEKLSNGSS